jgi:hypothetical protein
MDSTTQVVTQNSGPSSDTSTGQASHGTSSAKLKGNDLGKGEVEELPPPKSQPQKVKKPIDEEEFLKTKPSKTKRRAWEKQNEKFKEHEDYENLKTEIEETLASTSSIEVLNFFLDSQVFESKYEAAAELVDQARMVIEINAEPEKRVKAYASKYCTTTRT